MRVGGLVGRSMVGVEGRFRVHCSHPVGPSAYALEESLALSETSKMLSEDSARDLFKKTVAAPSVLQLKVTDEGDPPSFLQMQVTSEDHIVVQQPLPGTRLVAVVGELSRRCCEIHRAMSAMESPKLSTSLCKLVHDVSLALGPCSFVGERFQLCSRDSFFANACFPFSVPVQL